MFESKPVVPREIWDGLRKYGAHHGKACIILEGGESHALGHSAGDYDTKERQDEAAAERALAAIAVLNDALPNEHPLKLTASLRAAAAFFASGGESNYPHDNQGEMARLVELLDAILPPPPPAPLGFVTIGGG